MLVLSRKINECVVIGDLVEVSVLAISRDKVKLGFTAPKMISVHRKEVYDLIQKENEVASKERKVNLDDLLTLLKNN